MLCMRHVPITSGRMALATKVRGLGARPSKEQKLQILELRSHLQARIDSFESRRGTFYGPSVQGNADVWADVPIVEEDLGEQWDDVDGEANTLAGAGEPHQRVQTRERFAEHLALTLPSTLGRAKCSAIHAEALQKMELQLREGQANDVLHQIRIAVGQKSFLFREHVRKAKSQQTKTRAWAQVTTVDSNLKQHARVYTQIRTRMTALGASLALLMRFQELKPQHLKVNTAIAEPNARGQRKAKMAWYFTMDQNGSVTDSDWMEECECILAGDQDITETPPVTFSLQNQLVQSEI